MVKVRMDRDEMDHEDYYECAEPACTNESNNNEVDGAREVVLRDEDFFSRRSVGEAGIRCGRRTRTDGGRGRDDGKMNGRHTGEGRRRRRRRVELRVGVHVEMVSNYSQEKSCEPRKNNTLPPSSAKRGRGITSSDFFQGRNRFHTLSIRV